MSPIAVIGAGTMGNGIAHVLARSGFDVWLCEADAAALERGRQTIAANLGREVAKGKLDDAAAKAALGRIRPSLELAPVADATAVIEAITEARSAKLELWARVSALAAPDAYLASNTSSLSITELATAVSHPERFIGMHFMNPVPMMKLVEIIRGLATAAATCARAGELARQLGKTPVEVNDYPGFVSNRVLMPMINEAIYCVMEGVAEPSAVDDIMKLGMSHPLGPLALADLIGLDVCLHIMQVLHEGFADSKYRPCPLLRKMVAAGRLGRKSGLGFYAYPPA